MRGAWATDGGNSLAALEIEGGFKETFNHGVIAVILAPMLCRLHSRLFVVKFGTAKIKNMHFLRSSMSLCEECIQNVKIRILHTLRVHYAHAAANLNSGYSKYTIVARVHYFCTIALRTSRTVLTRA